MRIVTTTLAIAVLLSGCATTPHPPHVVLAASANAAAPAWSAVVTQADRARLAALSDTWRRALAAVPTRLKGKLDAEGTLLVPGAALELPSLPPGPYYCRLVRLGGRAGLASFKPDFCSVEGNTDKVSFTKQSGTSLPGGWLFQDGDKRQVFLGTFRPAGVRSAPAYSLNPAQDVAGVIERVGPFRWRLVLARAGKDAVLDVYELVPVTPAVAGAKPAVPG